MMTPYEKLKSLFLPEKFLKDHITAEARTMRDNEAAERLNDARAPLFKTIFNRSKTAACPDKKPQAQGLWI